MGSFLFDSLSLRITFLFSFFPSKADFAVITLDFRELSEKQVFKL